MMKGIKKHLQKHGILPNYQTIIDKAWAKPWVVYSDPSFAGAKRVIAYLGSVWI